MWIVLKGGKALMNCMQTGFPTIGDAQLQRKADKGKI